MNVPSVLRPSRWRCWLAGPLVAVGLPVLGQSPSVLTSHDAYVIGEDVAIEFKGGLGNPKDWVGIYPVDVAPGSTPSTRWFYGDGTGDGGGTTGVKEGVLTFPGGLNFAGEWKAYLLLNDGYEILAETSFWVVEEGTPLVRTDKREYVTGEDIVATFASGPAYAKDWIAIYQAGETPGDPPSTRWSYVDGTEEGATGVANGTITFTSGLTTPGSYVAYFLLDDSYTILATETFSVVAPAASTPRLLSLSPTDGATGITPLFRFSASITNGTSKVVLSSVVLQIDGQEVAATKDSVNDLVTVAYESTQVAAPSSAHTYRLTFVDDATPANEFTVAGTFTIASYENIVLPAPIVLETFDDTPEGQLPAGWEVKSYSVVENPDFDLGNLDSASFANWLVIDVDRFTGSFVTYSNPENPEGWGRDYQRVLTPNLLNVLNGQVVTNLATGRMLFASSGYRNGGNQVLFAFSPLYDLTGRTDVHVVFSSLYEQNQDSIGALEYSVDGGTSWLPVVYLMDRNDLQRTEDGEIDAEATFYTPAGDIAVYTNDDGVEVGGTYGSFIAAPITAALAPYIQGRVDDDARESKRIEKFRLPEADHQASVRLRFAYAGTDSWYWGVDNLGLYSLSATPGTPPALAFTVETGGLRLSWPAEATGYVLYSATALNPTAWTPVNGVTDNSVTIPFGQDSEYFQLREP